MTETCMPSNHTNFANGGSRVQELGKKNLSMRHFEGKFAGYFPQKTL